MWPNKKFALALALVLGTLGGIAASFCFPLSWATIRAGETEAEVSRKTTGAEHPLYALRAEFFYVDKSLIRWMLIVEYAEESRKTNTLQLGIQNGIRKRVRTARIEMFIRNRQHQSWNHGRHIYTINLAT